jgi:hypothetical protein
MNTPSLLYCATCGARLWRDPNKQLIHDPPVDHIAIPTANPKDVHLDVAGSIPEALRGKAVEQVGDIVERVVPAPQWRYCAVCLSVRVPAVTSEGKVRKRAPECHGCAGRTVGPLTVERLKEYGLAARS